MQIQTPRCLQLAALSISASVVIGVNAAGAPTAGDRIEITIPIEDISPGAEMSSGCELGGFSSPTWIDLLPASELGPLNLSPGSTREFVLNLEIKDNASLSNGDGQVQFTITASSSVRAACRLLTNDYFSTTALQCDDSSGEPLSVTLLTDTLAPATTIEILVTPYVSPGGVIFMQAGSSVALVSLDPVDPTAVRSGVETTFYRRNSFGGYLEYVNPFALQAGDNTLEFYSTDLAANVEPSKTVTLRVDGDSPFTIASREGYSPESLSGKAYLNPGDRLVLAATDPVSLVASGISRTVVQVDNGVYFESTGTLSFADGFHRIDYYSVDNVENAESSRRLFIFAGVDIDTIPPSSILAFTGPYSIHESSVSVSTETAIRVLSSDTPQGYATGLQNIFVLIDRASASCGRPIKDITANPEFPQGTCENPIFTSTFTLTPGTHTLEYWGIDAADDEEPIHVLTIDVGLSAQADTLPPRTALVLGPPEIVDNFISSATLITFAAADDRTDANDASGVGVAETSYSVDGVTYAAFTGGFILVSEGTHTVSFFSIDLLGHAESPTTRSLSVDLTAPNAAVVSSGALYAIDAVDPVVAGAASGIGEIQHLIDTDPESCAEVQPDTAAPRGTCANLLYTGPFSLSIGTHTVLFIVSDRVGNGSEVIHSSQVVVAEGPVDSLPPRTSISVGPPKFTQGESTYVTAASLLGFSVVDDSVSLGDGLGVGATQTFYADNGGAYVRYTSSFTLVAEGTHTISYFSTDLLGHAESPSTQVVTVDVTAPVAQLLVEGPLFTIEAEDPVVSGAASGVEQIEYIVDTDPETCGEGQSSTSAAPGTCANPHYAGPFSLAVGTHTVIFVAIDNLGNGNEILHSSYVVVAGGGSPSLAVAPSTGPIGIPFTVAGTGFGAYGGSNTRIKFGTTVASVSVWNDTTISGTIPGLSTGTYAVAIERQHASSVTSVSAGVFTVTGLEPQSLSVFSGPIGIPFTISGSGFGPYAGSYSRVLVGGTASPLSVWNDTTITGTIPGVPSGETTIQLVRTTSDGGISLSEAAPFTVTTPSVTAISPSSGPIGAAFALSGASFGPYAGSNSVVLIGGTTAPVSVWNDAAIAGTIPGGLMPGLHPMLVERRTADGGLARANTVYFEVTGLGLSSLNPSTGPIGVPFTIHGAGFGAYGGSNTRVKFGDAVASVSLWNNTTINGTVPSLSTGTWTVVVERQQGASVSQSNTASFTLTALEIATLTPSSGSIGAPFTITGTGYGPYAGTNSRVLIGGATASVSVWNDTTISGSIPALPAGPHAVRLERVSGAGLQASPKASILVVDPAIAAMSPSSGPIGIGFTVTGAGFGPYGGANTVLLIGGSTASVSLWNDTTIIGTVPGSLPTGLKPVMVKRIATGGSATSNAAEFQVTGMSLDAVNPSSGPIGAPFTVTGTQFGTYGGSNTRLRVGGVVAAVSLWNDTTITGTVPNLAPGVVDLVVERQQGTSVALSNFSSFTVVALSPTGLAPTTGPIGTAFTLTG